MATHFFLFALFPRPQGFRHTLRLDDMLLTDLTALAMKCTGKTVHPVATNPKPLSAPVEAKTVTLGKCGCFSPTSY